MCYIILRYIIVFIKIAKFYDYMKYLFFEYYFFL